jgi:hypothetical protein
MNKGGDVSTRRIIKSSALLFALMLCAGAAQGQAARGPAVLPKWAHEGDCAVRFVYNPPIPQDNIVIPLILRQTTEQDPRYGTWSTLVPEGLTQWISTREMQSLVDRLEKLNLMWDVSLKPISFSREPKVPPPPPPHLLWKMPMARRVGTMEIDITSDAGSAVADLPSDQVCGSMERLDPAFQIPIAVYTFRGTRLQWGCKVPGFNLANRPEAPKHGPN